MSKIIEVQLCGMLLRQVRCKEHEGCLHLFLSCIKLFGSYSVENIHRQIMNRIFRLSNQDGKMYHIVLAIIAIKCFDHWIVVVKTTRKTELIVTMCLQLVGHPLLWHKHPKASGGAGVTAFLSAADRFSASAFGAYTCKKCINPPSKYDAVQISSAGSPRVCVRVFFLSGCRFYVNKSLRQFLMRPGSRTEIILISLRQPHNNWLLCCGASLSGPGCIQLTLPM